MDHDSAGDDTVTTAAAPSEVQAPAEVAQRRGDRDIMRVSSSSNPSSLASAVSHAIYDNKKVTLRAIGHGAVGQAMKAVAIARGYVGPRGFDIAVVPGWDTAEGNFGDQVSAMTFRIVILE
jgi:stage V sporulation protein S